jgi:nucleotide-binding universal stress UspA family protein
LEIRAPEGASVAKRILIPLDGNPSSEAVLPLVAGSAQGAGATVRLLSVAPVPGDVLDQESRVVASAEQEMARVESLRASYLEGVAASLGSAPVERVVRFGDPVSEILIEVEAWAADLVAMTAPSARWLDRARPRPVADRVAGRVKIPVVLYRPPRDRRRIG